ncbi:MAG: DNA translocase SftA [Firmicutes bacterium ADurb.Bin419]|nr:MAG: DNA translocase SftA [Firmicutes bacterium ADurb.Bin419]
MNDRYIFEVKVSKGTRVHQISDYAEDIRRSLKLPLFMLVKDDISISIVVSEEKINESNFWETLRSMKSILSKMRIPYVVGHDAMGETVIVDLANCPHLVIGGSTNSGKTTSLLILILSIVLMKSVNKVNLLLFDMGAGDLAPFCDLPHLSHPIIKDTQTGVRVLTVLKQEMERRIEIKNSAEFKLLPNIVCIIDEFPSFISEVIDKVELKALTETLSSLLRRGRHAKISIVLAAQDPTVKNMKCDISNITTRIAFACAKPQYSVTILGEGGAEKLNGQGNLLFKSRDFNGLRRAQGSYVSSRDIEKALSCISYNQDSRYKFEIKDSDIKQQTEMKNDLMINSAPSTSGNCDDLLAKIIIYALGLNSISCNVIEEIFRLGYRRASGYLNKLYQLNIIGDKHAKLPRPVLPIHYEDLSAEIISFLKKNGYSEEYIKKTLNTKH